MPESRYDCIVIGSGPGGYVAAIRAAQLGMKTACVEKEFIGGRCLNVACIPAKAVLRAADVLTEVREAADFGIKLNEPEIDFTGVGAHRDKVVKTLTGGVSMLLKKNKVDLIEGEAGLTPDGKVRVGGDEIEAGTIVLATGSVSKPILGLEFGGRVLDTAAAWLLNEQPKRLAVVGAGASGTEIASAFGRLGTETVLLEALPQILPLEDPDIARTAAREIGKQGIKIVTGANIEKADVSDSGVTLDWGEGPQEFDYIAIAAGRGPDVEALGLAEAGIEVDERGQIKVDGRQKTTRDGVYAIGDIVPGPWLAHKASEQGVIAVEAAAGQDPHPLDLNAVPAATFCYPQVASFGLTEPQAKEAGYDVTVGKIPMGAVGAPTVYGDRGGMIKIVGDKKYGEILGAHIVSAKAADLIEELVVAKELEGGYPELAKTIHPHPAFAEAVLEAARATDGWLIHG
ncbi:MAG TPA: dihydrolipoyl dehydrogenase [Thermoleophilaceae bacterium]|nr:dihydrolipoyl dehydrogenase [Thermoleophilaceae bacterium]